MDENELLEIKQLIEKRLKDKTGLDFEVNYNLDITDLEFSVDLVFRRFTPCFDIIHSKDIIDSLIENFIDVILYMLAMDLDQTNDLLKEKLDLWE